MATKKRTDGSSRCAFLINFLQGINVTVEQAAEILGMTRQNFWLRASKKDTFSIANARKLVEHFGYSMNIFITRDPAEFAILHQFDVEKLFKVTIGESKGNIAFLRMAMSRYDLSQEDIARACGVSKSCVAYYFATDDITIDKLYLICESLKMSMKITIKPCSEDEPYSPTEQVVVTDISTHTRADIAIFNTEEKKIGHPGPKRRTATEE